jgi:ribosomal-protein-alanine N-acetyltransferase
VRWSTAAIPEILTDRLLLRGLREEDLPRYREIFTDPEVIRHLPIQAPGLTEEQVRAGHRRVGEHWRRHGYGVWAVCDPLVDELIGHCGLRYLEEIEEPELLYAIARPYWNRGLTTEVARASLEFGFGQAGLDRIIALAVPENTASIRVMEKVGMYPDGEDDLFGLHLVRYAIRAPGLGPRSW